MSDGLIPRLPPNILATVLRIGRASGGVRPQVRAVCREWRAAFDGGVATLSAVAPWPLLCGGCGLHEQCGGTSSSPLPLELPNLVSCELAAVTPAALERLLACLAAGSPRLTSLRVSKSALTALPRSITALAPLASLSVNHTALAVLPYPLRALSALTELNASHNALVAVPERIASDLPRLRRLDLTGNLLTDLPRLPGGLLELRVSQNRLKRLDAGALASLTALTLLEAVSAFSHADALSHEASPVIGALAALSRARGAALSLRLDAGVADLVRLRRAWAP